MPTINCAVLSLRTASEAAEGLLKPASDIRRSDNSAADSSLEGLRSKEPFRLPLEIRPRLSEVRRLKTGGVFESRLDTAMGTVVECILQSDPFWEELSEDLLPVESGVVDCLRPLTSGVRLDEDPPLPLLASILNRRVSWANLRISGSLSIPRLDLEFLGDANGLLPGGVLRMRGLVPIPDLRGSPLDDADTF